MGLHRPGPLGQLLRAHRLAAGLTQEDLAERAGMSARSVSDIERGLQWHPYPGTIKRLGDALSLGPDERNAFQAAWQSDERSGGRALQPVSYLAARPTNLPDDPTPFIGRGPELAAVTSLLRDPAVRLLTLTGTGGAGKTRLSLRAAGALLPAFQDGVYLVSLASLASSALVPSAIAQVLDITEDGGGTLLDRLAERLAEKHLLLVLDNFEHLLAAAPVVAELLDRCRRLHILVTSRVPLHLSREREYGVPPLTLPDPAHELDPATLVEYDAVALFTDRARAVCADFTLTPENAAPVAQICASLEGLPLAIELAAARVKLFAPPALLDQLADRLRLLASGPTDRPARLQSMRGAIDWSYGLLSPVEQALFADLSVFAGGWTLEAAAAVCGADEAVGVLEVIAGLVDKSLVRRVDLLPGAPQEPRFSMLETIRAYAAERLAERGAAAAARDRHAGYFLGLVPTILAEFQGPEQQRWAGRLTLEIDNLRAALRRLLEAGRHGDELWLASALIRFWVFRGLWREGEQWLRAGLEGGREIPAETRAWALTWLGELAWHLGEYGRQRQLEEEAVALFRELDIPAGIARAQGYLALALVWLGERDLAFSLAQDSLALARAHGCAAEEGQALNILAMAATGQALNVLGVTAGGGDLAAARAWMEASLAVHRSMGDRHRIAVNLNNLGAYALQAGDLAEAERRLWEALAVAEELEVGQLMIYALSGLGRLADLQGQQELAAERLHQALVLARELGARGYFPQLEELLRGVGTVRA